LKAMVHRTLRTLDGLDAELGSLMPEPTDSRSVVDSNS
jgi:hypothetical protein